MEQSIIPQRGNGPIRVGLLSNPKSGRNKRHFPSFRPLFQSYANLLHAEVVTPDEIAKALAGFAEQEVELVVTNGGDGTVQATVDALMNDQVFPAMPLLAVLPSGTANLIAGDVGLGPYRPETIRQLMEMPTARLLGALEKRALLRLKFPDGRRPMYGMFFGVGAIYYGTQLGRATKQSIGRLGEWGAGLILAKFLVALAAGSKKGLHAVPIGLSLGKAELMRQEYLVLFVTTLDRLFLGMKPFWSSELGPLHCTGLTVPYRYLWRCLPALLRGKEHPFAIAQHGYMSHNPSEIHLQLTSGFVLDGEVYDPPGMEQPMVLESGGDLSFVRLPS